ncbi:extracellular solute-binding protein [Thiothrix subterranea]|uniref:ABC transporter substrate-binding protein n=1 Tax=Thiothrix subterranea TaxID=2735563 RepID=UPI00192B32EF|nr:extracellular solute-binding protein [Thiothrix subterranea]QQZ27291.1 extracellular solute-binding protein [Thiothrix subterranea]
MKSFAQWFGILLLASTGSSFAEDLTVMTSYPEDVVSRFEEAFEKAHPDIHVQILWRMPHDALPYLLQPQQGGVDVYWTPSQGNFLALKNAKALGPIGIDRSGLPDKIGTALISDPDGLYLANETAGYGMVVDPDKLGKLGVAEPKRWQDLADPRLQGEVALPVPSGVGFAPMLIDQLLQAEGWEKGWNTWRAIALNSKLIDKRGNAITDEVSSGRAAVGLTMDFFAASNVASGGKGKFIYPLKTAFNPAQIGITASTTHRPAAETFVSFILSEEGQSLLFHPAIRKLPVRPSVYSKAPEGYTNPFTLGIDARYDPVPGLARSGFNSALFDAAITRRQDALLKAWASVRKAENGASPSEQPLLQQARTALEALPVAEPTADSPLVKACEQRRKNTSAETQCAAAEREWDAFFTAHYADAQRLADTVLAARQGKAP